MKKILISIFALVVVVGCQLAPDSFSVGSRVDRYGKYDSTTFTALYRNPWKHQHVVEEYAPASGGSFGGEAP